MRVKIVTKTADYAGKLGKLILDDGTVLDGEGFGGSAVIFGEIVFNTGMVGYVEALTDPSYNGQILTLTYPLVGNYGVPDPAAKDDDGIPKFFESDCIQARGLVVHELSSTASHWNMNMTLDEWMYKEGIPGISNMDTRALTKKLRTGGVMMAALAVSDSEIDVKGIQKELLSATPYTSEQFMDVVSTREPRTYGYAPGTMTTNKACVADLPDVSCDDSIMSRGSVDNVDERPVIVIDTGTKHAILRSIRALGYRVVMLPWDVQYDEIASYNPKGVVLSSGPGDPEKCTQTITTAKQLIKNDVPTLGICLGAQILGLAGDARTYKLKYGHRGQNKPCVNLETGQVYVTSQNHGYGISPDSLPDSEFEAWFVNADDKTVEGIRHRTNRCIAVQFHPEAAPGPYDCRFVFEDLKQLIESGAGKKQEEERNDIKGQGEQGVRE